jgi:hypothetical protein
MLTVFQGKRQSLDGSSALQFKTGHSGITRRHLAEVKNKAT